MDIGILYSWLGHFEYIIVTLLHNAINFQLLLCEFSGNRHGARVVRTVVIQFAAGVAQGQPAVFQWCVAGIAVHDLAVLCKYGGKRNALRHGTGDTVNLSANKSLGNAWGYHTLCRGVHLVAYIAGTLYGFNFLLLLSGAHLYYGFDKRY